MHIHVHFDDYLHHPVLRARLARHADLVLRTLAPLRSTEVQLRSQCEGWGVRTVCAVRAELESGDQLVVACTEDSPVSALRGGLAILRRDLHRKRLGEGGQSSPALRSTEESGTPARG